MSSYLSGMGSGDLANVVSHGKTQRRRKREKNKEPKAQAEPELQPVLRDSGLDHSDREHEHAAQSPSYKPRSSASDSRNAAAQDLSDSIGTMSMGAHAARHLRRKLASTEEDVKSLTAQVDELESSKASLESTLERERQSCKQQAKKMVTVIERLLDERNEVRIRVDLLEREHKSSTERANELEKEVATLRQLLKRDLRGNAATRKRTEAEERFWDEVATPEILVQSKPPKGFIENTGIHPASSIVIDRATADRDTELRSLRSQHIKLKEELKAAQRAAESASTDNLSMRESLSKTQQNSADKIRRTEQRLVGAMRRIQFLLSQQEEDKMQKREQEQYVMNLEKKVLDQDKRIQTMKRKLKEEKGKSKAHNGNGNGVSQSQRYDPNGRTHMGGSSSASDSLSRTNFHVHYGNLNDSFGAVLGDEFGEAEIEHLRKIRDDS